MKGFQHKIHQLDIEPFEYCEEHHKMKYVKARCKSYQCIPVEEIKSCLHCEAKDPATDISQRDKEPS
jgi:hypothetical protein